MPTRIKLNIISSYNVSVEEHKLRPCQNEDQPKVNDIHIRMNCEGAKIKYVLYSYSLSWTLQKTKCRLVSVINFKLN